MKRGKSPGTLALSDPSSPPWAWDSFPNSRAQRLGGLASSTASNACGWAQDTWLSISDMIKGQSLTGPGQLRWIMGFLGCQFQEECRQPWMSDQLGVKTSLYRLPRVPFHNQASLMDCFGYPRGESVLWVAKILCARLDRLASDPTASHHITQTEVQLCDCRFIYMMWNRQHSLFFNSLFIVKLIWEILHGTPPSYRFRLDVPRKTLESAIVKRLICV